MASETWIWISLQFGERGVEIGPENSGVDVGSTRRAGLVEAAVREVVGSALPIAVGFRVA